MMDGEERALFTKGVQDATARGSGADLDATLAELGWSDALVSDERVAVAALFEAQGRSGSTSGALDVVLARALGAPDGPVVLPALGCTSPPGRMEDAVVAVEGLATAGIRGARGALVVCTTPDGLALTELDLGSLRTRVVRGLDPLLGLVAVDGTAAGDGARPLASGDWDRALAAGQRAIAHELIGASAAMVDQAREHAVERVQFDVPIASFQAIRHKLADSLVAVESARAALDAAWDADTAFDATVSKAIAGRSARLVAKHAQQVLAGIGFTTEHPLHRYVKRVRVLDGLLGDSRRLTRAIGEQLLAAGSLPTILPL